MGIRLQVVALSTTVLGSGCGFFFEPTPDLETKKTVEAAGLQVDYPGNWEAVVEAEDVEGTMFTTVTIESSGNALAMIQVFEPAVAIGPQEAFAAFIDGMKEAASAEFGGVFELSVRGEEAFSRDVLAQTWDGRTGTVEVEVFGEKVPNRIQTLQRTTEDETIIIIAQAPIEDWAKVEPGFDAIYDGLVEK